MSYERALKAINLELGDMIPQIEFLRHPQFVHKITGMDNSEDVLVKLAEANRRLDLDMIWYESEVSAYDIKNHPEDYEVTDWGGTDSIWRKRYPVDTVEDVLNYSPLENFEITDNPKERAAYFNIDYKRVKDVYGDSVLVPGGYYTTLVQWPIMVFGWELFLTAAASEPERFAEILEEFAELSRREITAWTELDIKVFISHDDLAMTSGPFFSADWYRKNVFPVYKKLWKPLKEKGIKVIFCSDGKIESLMDDIVEAGADGFIFEPVNDLKGIVKKYGNDKILIGNIDTKILTFGSFEDIENEVKRCVETAKECPGYFLNVSGQIPHNVPLENAEFYFECCKKYRVR